MQHYKWNLQGGGSATLLCSSSGHICVAYKPCANKHWPVATKNWARVHIIRICEHSCLCVCLRYKYPSGLVLQVSIIVCANGQRTWLLLQHDMPCKY